MENSQELATDVLVEETVMVEETSPEMAVPPVVEEGSVTVMEPEVPETPLTIPIISEEEYVVLFAVVR